MYFGIGIYQPKRGENVGTLWRTAHQLGATFIFTIGTRYKRQHSDTLKTPYHIPLYHYADINEFKANLPHGCQIVAVEMGGEDLRQFEHPQRCVYLLGAEDHGLSENMLARCHQVVSIPAVNHESYNVAVAGALVMWDRFCKRDMRW